MSNQTKIWIAAIVFSLLGIHLPMAFLLLHFAGSTPVRSGNSHDSEALMLRFADDLPIVDILRPQNQTEPEKPSARAIYSSSTTVEQVAKPKAIHNSGPPKPQAAAGKSLQTAKNQVKPNQQTTAAVNPIAADDLTHHLASLKSEWGTQSALPQQHATSTPAPPVASYETLPGGGYMPDFLPNIRTGDTTQLNTIGDPSLEFIVEQKRKFRTAFDSYRAFASYWPGIRNKSASVTYELTLDDKGQLLDLRLIKSSDLSAFDTEAARTIKSSAPFRAPPEKYLDQNRHVIVQWRFVLVQ